MANHAPKNSVWAAMEYKPPRGRCNYKTGIMSSCPCLRFMLHPVKAATSFDCDGCGHHASFHSLENQQEDTVLAKWAEEEASNKEVQAASGASKKRRRIADKPADDEFKIFELPDDEDEVVVAASSSTRRKQKPTTRKTTISSSSQARNSGPD